VESVSRIYAQDFDPLADRYLLHGDPDVVAARLTEYHAAGSATVIFSAACQPERRPAVTGLFAQACFPAWHGTSTMASPSNPKFPPSRLADSFDQVVTSSILEVT